MNVLVLNPPYFKKFSRAQRSPAVTKSGTLYYPIWLAYATGVLEDAGFNVKLIDAPAEGLSLKDVLDISTSFNPQLIVIDTSTPSIFNDLHVAEDIKKVLPASFITLVGTHVSALPDEVFKLNSNFDAIARHEYDYTILELANAINKKSSIEQIAGLSYRKGKEVIHNPSRPFIKEMNKLPFISKVIEKHLNTRNYFNPNSFYPMITLITGRGCPNKCSFCVIPQTLQGRGYRQRSPESVVEEFAYIKENFPEVRGIFIEDDTFTVNKKRCRDISELILKRGIKIRWTANARADVDYETLRLMGKAGCRSLCVGFESGNQDILNNMYKGMKLESMYKFMEDARKAKVLVHGCFMVGNPGETKESLLKTLDLAIYLNPDTAQFYPIMVYPGTEAYEWAKEKGFLKTEDYSKWLTDEGLHNSVVGTEKLSPEELVKFCDFARKKFYLRPRYIFSKLYQIARTPDEITRKFKAFRTFVKYLIKGSSPHNEATKKC